MTHRLVEIPLSGTIGQLVDALAAFGRDTSFRLEASVGTPELTIVDPVSDQQVGPSTHLNWSELACRDRERTAYPAQWRQTRAPLLAAEFEAVRAEVGAPLTINSAYRTPAHNLAVGGSPKSQHKEGRALDMVPPTGMSPKQLYAICRDRAARPESLIGGLGLYKTFVHMDIRPVDDGMLTCWEGKTSSWKETKVRG